MNRSGFETLFIDHATIYTGGAGGRVLPDHGMYVENGVIHSFTDRHQPPKPAARTIDAAGKILLPGFINAHTHAYSAFARGLTGLRQSPTFIDILKNLWWRLDSALTTEDCYYSAMLLCIDSIRHGTTALIDHHASPHAVRGSLAEIERAVRESGLRACLCYEISDRDGAAICKEGIEENRAFVSRCAERNDATITSRIGLHASFTLKDETLEAVSALGRELASGFHIHLAESVSDQEMTRTISGLSVTERLQKYGILGPNTIAAHCVHLQKKEIDLLAETGTMVVHNPQSNLNNGVGIADLPSLIGAGVLVGLGTDAMTAHMPEEARVGVWAQHLRASNPSVGFAEIIQTLLVNNPIIAGSVFRSGIGSLAIGSPADLVLIDYQPTTPLTADNFAGHLIFGISQSVTDTTIVNGKVLMEGRRLTVGIDEEQIYRRSRELAASLWKRLSSSSS